MGVFLKLTSAIVLDGQISKAGDLVEVAEAEAKNLLSRGKAVLAVQDAAPDEGEVAAEAVEPEPEKAPKGKRGKGA